MAKVIHTMVRVLDLEKSLRFYADVLDLHEAHRLDFPDFALVYLRNAENDFELELTLNKGPGRGLHPRHGLRPHRRRRFRRGRHPRGTDGQGLRACGGQGVQARRRAAGALLLHPGPRWLQDRAARAAWSLPMNGAREPGSREVGRDLLSR